MRIHFLCSSGVLLAIKNGERQLFKKTDEVKVEYLVRRRDVSLVSVETTQEGVAGRGGSKQPPPNRGACGGVSSDEVMLRYRSQTIHPHTRSLRLTSRDSLLRMGFLLASVGGPGGDAMLCTLIMAGEFKMPKRERLFNQSSAGCRASRE